MNDPLKGFRRSLRAWRNRRRLDDEARRYRARFHRLGLAVPDERAVARALRARFPELEPVPKGAFNIVAATSYPDLSPAGLKDHVLWGALMLVIAVYGPGRLALDRWLGVEPTTRP